MISLLANLGASLALYAYHQKWERASQTARMAQADAETSRRLLAATGKRDAAVAQITKKTEKQRDVLKEIPDEGCLDRALPDDLLRMLNDAQ